MPIHKSSMKTAALVIASLAALSACQDDSSASTTELTEQAQLITGQFVSTLQPTLQNAMQEGGPVRGIEVCTVEAPRIAADLSADSGWMVTRVSLRARNHETAIPDEWETRVLSDFDQRQQAGEAVEQLNAAEVVNGEFRYMQAQATGPLCLTCHGTQISSDVQVLLDQHYPQDTATGYLAGQIRGAISLRKSL